MGYNEWITPSMKQWWCASSSLINVMGQGMTLGHTASLLPALQDPSSPIRLDIDEASWLASCLAPANLMGIAAACVTMVWIGRRKANLVLIIPGSIGWIMIYFAQSYLILFIGRVLTGVTAGGVCAIGLVVIAEYTSPQNRGMFLNLKTMFTSLGSAIPHILANFMHWRTIATVALILHVIPFLIALTWPESPSWLAAKQQYDKCEKEFFWLRGVTESSVREVTELIESQKQRFTLPKIGMKEKIREFFKKFKMKEFLKPLFIVMVALIVMDCSGRHFFAAYALQIMGDVIESKIPIHYFTLCIDIVVTVSAVGSAVLIRMINMRTLLFMSGIGSLVVLAFMCTFLYLTSIGVVSNYPWIITGLFIAFFAFGNLGCAPVPLALQGELFPLTHREVGCSLVSIFAAFLLLTVIKGIPYMLLSLGVYGTFAVFGIIMGAALLILYFVLPETKDKTLLEIENYFKYGKYRVNALPDEVYSKMLIQENQNASS